MRKRWTERSAGLVLALALGLAGATAAHANETTAKDASARPSEQERLLGNAEAGHLPSQLKLARRYETGQGGFPKDAEQALAWYRRAAEAGDPGAQIRLSKAYSNGRVVPKDDSQAVEWLSRAAERKHPRAMYLMAIHYEQGKGVPKNLVLAHLWMQRAAEAGSPAAQIRLPQLSERLTPEQRQASYRLRVHDRVARKHGEEAAGAAEPPVNP